MEIDWLGYSFKYREVALANRHNTNYYEYTSTFNNCLRIHSLLILMIFLFLRT